MHVKRRLLSAIFMFLVLGSVAWCSRLPVMEGVAAIPPESPTATSTTTGSGTAWTSTRSIAAIDAGSSDLAFDMNFDGVVDLLDLDPWFSAAATANGLSSPYIPGDANLDGHVDVSDFNIWNANKFTATASWCSGDFNFDGVVDGQDFIIWNQNKFTSS